LKSKKVKFILAVSERKEFKISSAAIPIDEKNRVKLERMIYKNEGSLRCGSSTVKGWTTCVSE